MPSVSRCPKAPSWWSSRQAEESSYTPRLTGKAFDLYARSLLPNAGLSHVTKTLSSRPEQIIAEAMMLIQVFLGVLLVTVDDYKPPRFHMFYGFVSFITIGLLYSYRYVWKAKGWMELAYGLGGLFIMGLGIRAVLQVMA